MGLLSKVMALTSLDETGQILIDNLIKLPRTLTLSDTALSMLKSYILFKAGACLRRDGNGYISYSILGFGLEELHISPEIPEGHSEKFYKIYETEIDELKNSGNKHSCYWVFNLTEHNFPEAVLLLRDDEGFVPETVRLILDKAADSFLPFEQNDAEDSEKKDAEEIINDFFYAKGTFNCCIFSASMDDETVCRISQSLEGFGELLPLKENAFLLLFSSSIGHAILLHHLNKSFHFDIVEQFLADAPQKALECIRNYA